MKLNDAHKPEIVSVKWSSSKRNLCQILWMERQWLWHYFKLKSMKMSFWLRLKMMNIAGKIRQHLRWFIDISVDFILNSVIICKFFSPFLTNLSFFLSWRKLFVFNYTLREIENTRWCICIRLTNVLKGFLVFIHILYNIQR